MSNREQFLLDRKKGIGGSDVASILGLSPWKTALDVYNDKLNPVIEEEINEDLRRGCLAEEFVLKTYADCTGNWLKTGLDTVMDKDYPFMRGNIDALAVEPPNTKCNIVVEAKTTKAPMSSWSDGIPEYYKSQVAYYAMLADVDRVDIAVLFSNWQYGCFTYWRDTEYEAKIKAAVIEFWHSYILKNIPPQPQNIEELKQAYPRIDEEISIKADEDIRTAVSELQEISNQRKALEEQEKALKINIQKYMGGAGLLDAGFCKVALKERCTRRLDTSALKEAKPEIYQEYLKESQSRVLQIIGG